MAAPTSLLVLAMALLCTTQLTQSASIPKTESDPENELSVLTLDHSDPLPPESLPGEALEGPRGNSDSDEKALKDVIQDDAGMTAGVVPPPEAVDEHLQIPEESRESDELETDDHDEQLFAANNVEDTPQDENLVKDIPETELHDLQPETRNEDSVPDSSNFEDSLQEVHEEDLEEENEEDELEEEEEDILQEAHEEDLEEENEEDELEEEDTLQEVHKEDLGEENEEDELEEEEEEEGGDENESAALELESMKPSSEERSFSDEEYDGYGSEDEDQQWIEVTDGTLLHKPEHFTSDPSDKADKEGLGMPLSPSQVEELEAYRPYIDDAIAAEEEEVDVHDDVKRGQKTIEVPGYPPLRVIELNETIYLNNTDEDSNLPKFQPVRIPDRFEDYDMNSDGLISLPELRYVTGAREGARQAFHDADTDGDGWVEKEEFQQAGWGQPVESPSSEKTVVFVPRENVQPSSIPRGAEGINRHQRHRLP